MSIMVDKSKTCEIRKLILTSEGGDSCSKKVKRDYGGAYGGVWWSLLLATVWSQAVGLLLVGSVEIWIQLPWRLLHI
jgi:hypothetical protein